MGKLFRRLALWRVRTKPPEELAISEEELDGLPARYRQILTAQGPTAKALEGYTGSELRATISQGKAKNGFLSRAVYLETGAGDVVSLGISRVNPKMLSADARSDLTEGAIPLGQILESRKIEHERVLGPEEAAYIKKFAGSLATDYLLGKGPHYGRAYTIFGRKGRLTYYIAEISEILSNRLLERPAAKF